MPYSFGLKQAVVPIQTQGEDCTRYEYQEVEVIGGHHRLCLLHSFAFLSPTPPRNKTLALEKSQPVIPAFSCLRTFHLSLVEVIELCNCGIYLMLMLGPWKEPSGFLGAKSSKPRYFPLRQVLSVPSCQEVSGKEEVIKNKHLRLRSKGHSGNETSP